MSTRLAITIVVAWEVCSFIAIFIWGINSPELMRSLSITLEFVTSRNDPTPAVKALTDFGISWASVFPTVFRDILVAFSLVLANFLGSVLATFILVKRQQGCGYLESITLLVAIVIDLVGPAMLFRQATINRSDYQDVVNTDRLLDKNENLATPA